VRYVHTIIHRMLKDSVRWQRLSRNPADSADPPKASAWVNSKLATWTADELRSFLVGTQRDRLYAAFVLLATTGMRRGEALGLRWSDVDIEAARASIVQTVIAVKHKVQFGDPKTARGARTVSLNAGTVKALREHRKRQAAERLQIGSGFTDHGLVFCHVDGGPLHPERFSRNIRLPIPPARVTGNPAARFEAHWATLGAERGTHRRWFRSGSGTPTYRSRWTSTAT